MQHSQKQGSVHRAGAQPGTPHTAAEAPGQSLRAGGGRGVAVLTALICLFEVGARFISVFQRSRQQALS